MTQASSITVPATEAAQRLARLFTAAGLASDAAAELAGAVVQADLDGIPSHGLQLADIYLARLRAGSITTVTTAPIVADQGALVVLDAHDMFGHLAARQAMDIAVDRARRHGIGAVAVRRGVHFGMAGSYAEQATKAGCIGIAMANVRPLMVAPGGAERVVGNNPLAIGIPTSGDPILLDMATSEAAFAKLRLAAAAGQPIPATWALDASGAPTTDPLAAMAGMLLPFGGAKGFALAFLIDLLCGLMSGGGTGAQVRGLMEVDQPMNCSFLFLAVDITHIHDRAAFEAEATAAADSLRSSRPAPGHAAPQVPGDQRSRRRALSNGCVEVTPAVAAALTRHEGELGHRR